MIPITPVEISHSTDAAWTDVDLSAYLGSDAGDVAGVVLLVTNTSGTSSNFGVRNNGSSDSAVGRMWGGAQNWIAIGIDSGDIFELFLATAADYEVWLVGYIVNSEGSFFTNRVDKSLTTTAAWTDIDISSDTGGDTALAAFFHIANTSFGNKISGLRENSSTDTFESDGRRNILFGSLIGVDGSEILEGYIETTDVDFYLVGYLTGNVTTFANGKSYITGTTGSYQDVDFSSDIPSGNTGAFCIFHNSTDAVTGNNAALRNKDDSGYDEYLITSSAGFPFTGIDSSRVAQQKIANTNTDLYLLGYTSEPSAGSALLDAAPTGSATAAASLTTAVTMAASAVGSAVATAALTTSIILASAVNATATDGASLTTEINLDAAVTSSGTAAVALTTETSLDGAVTISATQASSLTTQIELNSGVSAEATAAGELTVGLNLDAALTVNAAASGILATQIPLAASAGASAASTAQLSTSISFAANVSGQAASSGELTTDITLSTNATATVSTSGILNAQKIYNVVQRSADFKKVAATTALFCVTRNNPVLFTRKRIKEVWF